LAGGIQTAGLPGQSAATAGGIGGLLARTDTNGSAFYHADGLGNVTALINSSNYVVARYLYNPFGQVTAKWGPYADVNEMQFSSMPQHNPSGFSMYLYRAYDPHLQRWLNQDPIQEAGGINLYQYVGNDPINNIDPLGLWTFEIYGGWGFGAYFQIGYNDHHLSLSGGLGAAAGASISLDPKNTPSDLASGTWEGGLKGKLDFGEGPVGGGVEAEVGGTKDPCDHGKNYAKVGASGSFLFLSGSGDIGRETDEDGNNWHTTKEANWQENVPTSKNVWTGNWIPKERESAGGFFGPVIGYQF
jgi:RHS repeat-associated protein